jgi:sugar (pentulose or hexulose) kinase
MKQKFLMGLDAGGGSGRCLLVNITTGEVFSTTRPWTHPLAVEAGGWAYDLDLDLIWGAFGDAAQDVLQQAGASPEEVLGISATSMRHSTIVLDKKKEILFAVPNRDVRAADIGIQLAAEHGEEFQRVTGRWPIPCFTAVRLKWLSENTPEVFSEASIVMSLSEWLTYRLCDRIASDPSHAGETMLYDLHTGDWAWDLKRVPLLPWVEGTRNAAC